MKPLRKKIRETEYSIREISEKAGDRKNCIRFDIGQPDYHSPRKSKELAKKAIDNENISYTSLWGIKELRKKIADFESRKADFQLENIMVTTGGTGALFTAFSTFCEPEDNIVFNDPSWSVYNMIGRGAGVNVRRVSYFEDGELNRKAVEKKIDSNTKMIVINSPENPTGRVYTEKQIEGLIEIARENDLMILSDEVYDRLVFEGDFISPAEIAPERTLVVNSMSKTFSMTGWRLGWIATMKNELLENLGKMNRATTACPNFVSQKAGIGAIEEGGDYIKEMKEVYRKRRDLMLDSLEDSKIGFRKPEGGLYVFADIGKDSWKFSRKLLNKKGVAVVPGTPFGRNSKKFVRLCFGSVGEEGIKEGLERLKNEVM